MGGGGEARTEPGLGGRGAEWSAGAPRVLTFCPVRGPGPTPAHDTGLASRTRLGGPPPSPLSLEQHAHVLVKGRRG